MADDAAGNESPVVRQTSGMERMEWLTRRHPRYLPRRVTNAGTFRSKHRLVFIANALKQQLVGLEEVDDGIWCICFCNVLLARLDERDSILRA